MTITTTIPKDVLNEFFHSVEDECADALETIAANPDANDGDYIETEQGEVRLKYLWQDICDAAVFVAENITSGCVFTTEELLDRLELCEGKGIAVIGSDYEADNEGNLLY
jgi:hypothetical protein